MLYIALAASTLQTAAGAGAASDTPGSTGAGNAAAESGWEVVDMGRES